MSHRYDLEIDLRKAEQDADFYENCAFILTFICFVGIITIVALVAVVTHNAATINAQETRIEKECKN